MKLAEYLLTKNFCHIRCNPEDGCFSNCPHYKMLIGRYGDGEVIK